MIMFLKKFDKFLAQSLSCPQFHVKMVTDDSKKSKNNSGARTAPRSQRSELLYLPKFHCLRVSFSYFAASQELFK